jgi:hypothetical protein
MTFFQQVSSFLTAEEKDEWVAAQKLFCVFSLEKQDSKFGERWVLDVLPAGEDGMRKISFPCNPQRDKDYQQALDTPGFLPIHKSYIVKWVRGSKWGYDTDFISGGGPCPCSPVQVNVDDAFMPDFLDEEEIGKGRLN